jgi:hypothetical protein
MKGADKEKATNPRKPVIYGCFLIFMMVSAAGVEPATY